MGIAGASILTHDFEVVNLLAGKRERWKEGEVVGRTRIRFVYKHDHLLP